MKHCVKSKDMMEMKGPNALDGMVDVDVTVEKSERPLSEIIDDLDADFRAWEQNAKEPTAKVR
jgi:hypothetical protein